MLRCENKPDNSLAVAFAAGFGELLEYLQDILRHVDQALMRVIDVTMALPSFPLLIVISAFLGPNILNVILYLSCSAGQNPHVLHVPRRCR